MLKKGQKPNRTFFRASRRPEGLGYYTASITTALLNRLIRSEISQPKLSSYFGRIGFMAIKSAGAQDIEVLSEFFHSEFGHLHLAEGTSAEVRCTAIDRDERYELSKDVACVWLEVRRMLVGREDRALTSAKRRFPRRLASWTQTTCYAKCVYLLLQVIPSSLKQRLRLRNS